MSTPDILFLGFCSRAEIDRSGARWNVLGLSSILQTYLLPSHLAPFIALSVNIQTLRGTGILHILDQDGVKGGEITIRGQHVEGAELAEEPPDTVTMHPGEAWTPVFMPNGDGIAVPKPGKFSVIQVKDGLEIPIGGFQVIHIEAPPLTADRIAAIRSDPRAAKSMRIQLGCKRCPATYRVYFGLDRDPKLEAEGWRWSPEIQDTEFKCTCGVGTVELRYVKSGLVALLGRPSEQTDLNIVPLYERSALQQVRDKFHDLLNSEPQEERIQRFITDNPILLHMFSAVNLIPKPSIGTKFAADFAILDARGRLGPDRDRASKHQTLETRRAPGAGVDPCI